MTWRRERRQRGVSTAGQAASDSEPTFFEAVAQVQAEAFRVLTSPVSSFVCAQSAQRSNARFL
jgi:hypothetical protein